MSPANHRANKRQGRARTHSRAGRLSVYAATLVAMIATIGCAALKDSEQIIRVQASRDSGEAARLTLVGVKALHEGDADRASTKFLAAVEADSTYGPAHNNLGLLHYERGDLYQAVLAFEQAMELMPQDPAVYYNLALTLESAGKVHEAMDLYWQAVEMDPTNPNFLGNLVRLRVRLGESDPSLVTQLQDLILIETRPDWRRWADRQLALTFNPTLDRGPDPPDFDPGNGSDRAQDEEALMRSKIIELSPTTQESANRQPWQPATPESLQAPRSDGAVIAPTPKPRESIGTPPPIRDEGSLENLPPSIRVDR